VRTFVFELLLLVVVVVEIEVVRLTQVFLPVSAVQLLGAACPACGRTYVRIAEEINESRAVITVPVEFNVLFCFVFSQWMQRKHIYIRTYSYIHACVHTYIHVSLGNRATIKKQHFERTENGKLCVPVLVTTGGTTHADLDTLVGSLTAKKRRFLLTWISVLLQKSRAWI
jgi:hypothetical protein